MLDVDREDIDLIMEILVTKLELEGEAGSRDGRLIPNLDAQRQLIFLGRPSLSLNWFVVNFRVGGLMDTDDCAMERL